MIKGVIFDIDNTLVDFCRMKDVSVREAIDAMVDAGLPISKSQAFKIIHGVFGEMGIEAHKLFQTFSKRAVGKVDHKIVGAAIVAHKRIWNGLLHTYPGVIRTLIQLREMGLKLSVVSDANRIPAYERLYGARVVDFFDFVVAHEDTHQYKPARKPFQHALNLMKLQPAETVMVGDWIKGDVIGAKRLGLTTCWAKYGAYTKESKDLSDKAHLKRYKTKADCTLQKIEDIIKFVEKINKK